MTDTAAVPGESGRSPACGPVVDEQLADQLLAKAAAEGRGVCSARRGCSQVRKAVLERALAEALTEHLGYEKHDRTGRGEPRNGSTPKRLLTEVGPVELAVPRDRAGRIPTP